MNVFLKVHTPSPFDGATEEMVNEYIRESFNDNDSQTHWHDQF